LDKKRKRLKELEVEISQPDFWTFPGRAAETSEEYAALKKSFQILTIWKPRLNLRQKAVQNKTSRRSEKRQGTGKFAFSFRRI